MDISVDSLKDNVELAFEEWGMTSSTRNKKNLFCLNTNSVPGTIL